MVIDHAAGLSLLVCNFSRNISQMENKCYGEKDSESDHNDLFLLLFHSVFDLLSVFHRSLTLHGLLDPSIRLVLHFTETSRFLYFCDYRRAWFGHDVFKKQYFCLLKFSLHNILLLD